MTAGSCLAVSVGGKKKKRNNNNKKTKKRRRTDKKKKSVFFIDADAAAVDSCWQPPVAGPVWPMLHFVLMSWLLGEREKDWEKRNWMVFLVWYIQHTYNTAAPTDAILFHISSSSSFCLCRSQTIQRVVRRDFWKGQKKKFTPKKEGQGGTGISFSYVCFPVRPRFLPSKLALPFFCLNVTQSAEQDLILKQNNITVRALCSGVGFPRISKFRFFFFKYLLSKYVEGKEQIKGLDNFSLSRGIFQFSRSIYVRNSSLKIAQSAPLPGIQKEWRRSTADICVCELPGVSGNLFFLFLK